MMCVVWGVVFRSKILWLTKGKTEYLWKECCLNSVHSCFRHTVFGSIQLFIALRQPFILFST